MTLLAAFNVLLHRYSSQPDIIVGTPIAGRTRSELEPLIGFFVNTLALRTRLSHADTFSGVLARVRQAALEAYQHQDLPFERLVEELGVERSLSRTPVFQAMFAFQTAAAHPPRMSHLDVSRLAVEAATEKFDLTLALREGEEGITGAISYSADLFDPTTAARMARHFERLVESLVSEQAEAIGRVGMLSAAETQQLITEWNDTSSRYEGQACLHHLIERQAETTPDAVALAFEDQQLSYGELNRRANQLAHFLRACGISADSIVAICLDRSPLMLVALLGVLKSSAAYLPLDPDHPAERLRLILDDAQAPLLITHHHLLKSLQGHRAVTLCLDSQCDAIASHSSENPLAAVSPDNLAYVIYTSGSTGRPKGVQIAHRSVVNFLHSMCRVPGLDSHDVLVALTTMSFDIAALEMFLPLISGARVVVASRLQATDAEALSELIDRAEATLVQATPATWRMLVEAGWEAGTRVRALCGGEALGQELAEEISGRVSQAVEPLRAYGDHHLVGTQTGERDPPGREHRQAHSQHRHKSCGHPAAGSRGGGGRGVADRGRGACQRLSQQARPHG